MRSTFLVAKTWKLLKLEKVNVAGSRNTASRTQKSVCIFNHNWTKDAKALSFNGTTKLVKRGNSAECSELAERRDGSMKRSAMTGSSIDIPPGKCKNEQFLQDEIETGQESFPSLEQQWEHTYLIENPVSSFFERADGGGNVRVCCTRLTPIGRTYESGYAATLADVRSLLMASAIQWIGRLGLLWACSSLRPFEEWWAWTRAVRNSGKLPFLWPRMRLANIYLYVRCS